MVYWRGVLPSQQKEICYSKAMFPRQGIWYNEPMNQKLSFKQLINLEYFIDLDKGEKEDDLHARDRGIALELEEEGVDDKNQYLHGWLAKRGKAEAAKGLLKSPGDLFNEAATTLIVLTAFLGSLCGFLAGLTYFSYAGQTPINVLQFLLVFIASQLLLALLLPLLALGRKLLKQEIMPLAGLIFFFIQKKLILRLKRHWQKSLDARQRLSAEAALASLERRHTRYGPLASWSIFTLSQLFLVFFNLSLFLTTLARIATSDLAFGWQSTIQFSDQAIHTLVRVLALPWSWLMVDGSHPNLAEIAGSKIILKDGIASLATTDLVSWWPFLLCCLFCYGLLLRLFLFGGGILFCRSSLAKISQTTHQLRSILRRMQTPLLSSQAAPQEARYRPEAVQLQLRRMDTPFEKQFLLIPGDLYPASEILEKALAGLGFHCLPPKSFLEDYDQDQRLLELLAQKQQGQKGVVMVMEGWMVPLADFLSYLQKIRKSLVKDTCLTIALVGKPQGSQFSALSPDAIRLWQDKIASLADPHIAVIQLPQL